MMDHAQKNDCKVWLDLDYRPWNWPDKENTRLAYQKASELSNVLVGNEEEFQIHNIDSKKFLLQYTLTLISMFTEK